MPDKLVKITLEYEDRVATLDEQGANQWLDAHTKACQMLLEKLNINPFAWLPQDWKVLPKPKNFDEWKETVDGKRAADPASLQNEPCFVEVLEERLEAAFNAGCRSNSDLKGCCVVGSFGWMLEQLKEGVTCCRKDWYSNGIRIKKVKLPGMSHDSFVKMHPSGEEIIFLPLWDDIFATDWQVYD